jgi:hypothetical protein
MRLKIGRSRFNKCDSRIDKSTAFRIRIPLSNRCATDREGPVVTSSITVVTVQDIEEGGIAGPNEPVAINMRMRRATLPRDRIDSLYNLFTAMRTTLGADRAREHFEAHAKSDAITHLQLCSEEVVDWTTRGGSKALGLDDKIGSIEVGKKADIVLITNDGSPTMFPILNPYGHIAMQASRGDVHKVVIDGRVVKHEHRLVGNTVDYLVGQLGEETWKNGMYPDTPEKKLQENPYTYTTWDAGPAQWKQ